MLENLDILSSQLEALANTDITKAKKVNERDFCYRLVICYEDKDKFINYKIVSNLLEQLQQQETIAYNTEYTEQEQEQAKNEITKIQEQLQKANNELIQKPEYILTMKLANMLDLLTFDYAIKANKYAYLMNRNEFKNNMQLFNKLQKIDKNGTFKNTINLKNIKKVYNTIYYYLLDLLIKQKKATKEQEQEYKNITEQIKKQQEQIKKQQEQAKKQQETTKETEQKNK